MSRPVKDDNGFYYSNNHIGLEGEDPGLQNLPDCCDCIIKDFCYHNTVKWEGGPIYPAKCEGPLPGKIENYLDLSGLTGEIYFCPECNKWFRPDSKSSEDERGRFLCGICIEEI